jgi:hypothetical protein
MRKIAMGLGVALLLFRGGYALAKDKTFSGEIFDSQCAKEGSHATMLKKAGMGDKDPNDPAAKKACADQCVSMGGKYVLYNATSKTIYELDDQSKPAEFAGKKVKVTGTLDEATKTIHVTGIKAA